MPRSDTKHPEKSGEHNLLQEFDNSLPDFKNLDEEQHLKFVKAIRMICAYFNVSEARLQRDDFFNFRPTIVRLVRLYEEYHDKDVILASAILIVKLHIETHYLDGQEANLVHNLTGLHTYPLIRKPAPQVHRDASSRRTWSAGLSSRSPT
jgi:hypothetical protein